MTEVQYTRVLCEKGRVFDIADKLARLFQLKAVIEGPPGSPNPHTRWVTVGTGVPWTVAQDESADEFLDKLGIGKLSAMPGVVAYCLAPLNDEDVDGSGLQAFHKQPSHITGRRHFRYICVDNDDLNYDMYLDPEQVYQWPQPLRLMSDYILSDEFVSLALVLHGDVYEVKYEDDLIQPAHVQQATTGVDSSWANWKDSKRNRPQPKDDMED